MFTVKINTNILVIIDAVAQNKLERLLVGIHFPLSDEVIINFCCH
jgi:hypothetical protein